ncbi:amidase [Pseudomonas poae]|uniref:Amidase n=1 Tax=Pseudomonas poae TaxID=200451 RepID=A0A2S9E793_9PSED|nr:amidase [Pseudomonas poae]PRA24907.1 amidase [Pseudomonas poae]PRC10722.1 amidase [Pseudomonas poae]
MTTTPFMSQADYLALDATAMAEGVHNGSLAPEALLRAALERCDQLDPTINAVVMRHDDHAFAQLKARQAAGTEREGALAGVPMLLKDLNTYLAGTVTTNGSRLLGDTPPATANSTVVKRYLDAGMLVFGKTASPEFGMTTTTESSQWGRTRNPWNLDYSAGGSSGGAAAAVAAGIVPVAHATDGGGSIRIPAAYCGVFGMKPTRYRTPQGPNSFEGWFGASCGHMVSRSVRDSALLLDVSHGHERGSPYWLAEPPRPFREEVLRTPGALRIGVVSADMTGTPLDPEIAAVLERTVGQLRELGHQVQPLTLPVDPQRLYAAHGTTSGVALLAAVRDREAALGRPMPAHALEPVTQRVLEQATQASAERLYRARRDFEAIGLQMELLFDDIDLILSPVTGQLTPPLGRVSLQNSYEDYIKHIVGSIGFTVLANVSGQPAMSVPLGISRDGLPIGMMFSAAHCQEGLLFQLAGQLEQQHPWTCLPALQ